VFSKQGQYRKTSSNSFFQKNKNIPINLKRKVVNLCILPVSTYGMETDTLNINSANKLRMTQRAIEPMRLGISLRDHVENVEIRRTQVDDVIARIARSSVFNF